MMHLCICFFYPDGNFTFLIFPFSDLLSSFGQSVLPLLDVEPISDLLVAGRRSKTSKTKTLSTWATKEIRKLKNAQGVGTTTW